MSDSPTAHANPILTVILPVFNGGRYLRAAIESVVTQTFADWELLILDDNSTDDSREIAASFSDPRIRICRNEPRLGLAGNLNSGLRRARGELIARQDQDDISAPGRFAGQIRFLQDNPRVAVVGSEAIAIDADAASIEYLFRPASPAAVRWAACFANCMIHSSVMFRKRPILDEFGGYEDLYNTEDYDLWSRVGSAYDLANIPEPLLRYRVHGDSMMGTVSKEPTLQIAAARARVIQRNLRQLFAAENSEEQSNLLGSFDADASSTTVRDYLKLFHRLRRQYLTEHPELEHDPEMRRTLAMQFSVIAYKLLPQFRFTALKLYVEVLRFSCAVFTRLPWLRIIALLVAGKAARPAYLLVTKWKMRLLRPT